jgi:Cu/Ag efflux protein CusF
MNKMTMTFIYNHSNFLTEVKDDDELSYHLSLLHVWNESPCT